MSCMADVGHVPPRRQRNPRHRPELLLIELLGAFLSDRDCRRVMKQHR